MEVLCEPAPYLADQVLIANFEHIMWLFVIMSECGSLFVPVEF